MEVKLWVAVSIALIIAGGGGLAGLALIVASVRAGRDPVVTLASATALCLAVAALIAFRVLDAAVFT